MRKTSSLSSKCLRTATLCCIWYALFICKASAQQVYHFTQGLTVSSGSQYGREAVFTDPLAWKLYNDALAAPKAGDTLSLNTHGEPLIWKAVQADSSGRFRRGMEARGRNAFMPGSADRGADYLYLTYSSLKEKNALLHISGNSGVFVNGVPHMGDPYGDGYLYIPILLRKGLNEFYVHGTNVWPEIIFPEQPVYISTQDPTLPNIVLKGAGEETEEKGAVVIINTSSLPLTGYRIKSEVGGQVQETALPVIAARTCRKVIFAFQTGGVKQKGDYTCRLTLIGDRRNAAADVKELRITAMEPAEHYSNTFVSDIDGSLQYYAVTPQLNGPRPGSALFLSVHGAGVEAIGQARAYRSKDWGTLVAATNRRPRGFDWEDWGRLDALEVLAIGEKLFAPDPSHIYLTGHSMGGHGTWYLGATYPDKWAAIGACSGYPNLKAYASFPGSMRDSTQTPAEQVLSRAGDPGDVLRQVYNYKPFGVYVLHGDSDRTVPVRYARQMRALLGTFHPDFSYHEVPGADHWYGNQSVDWDPMFDFFKGHARLQDSAVNDIDFTTANPGISSVYRWASVVQQTEPLAFSRIQLHRDRRAHTITGATDNISLLCLTFGDWAAGTELQIKLDDGPMIRHTTGGNDDTLYLSRSSGQWVTGQKPPSTEKGPRRYGTFKEAFAHRMVFVYGTTGSPDENAWSYNKALFDAETWYYRGNGAVDIVPDKAFSPQQYTGRSVLLYGNAATNSAWQGLLGHCPIQVTRHEVKVGAQTYQGDDLGAYFVWPREDDSTSVGVVSGTGLKGMKAAYANQYYSAGSGFPDYLVFRLDMLQSGGKGVVSAGFFDNRWELFAPDKEIK